MKTRLLGLLLATALPVAVPLAQSPSSDVAVGVFPFLEGNMDGRISEIVTNCVQNGIDTLYVSVFRATGPQTGDLWITDSAGDWNPAWGQVRRTGAGIHLVNLITACHAANLRVVAVLKCFDGTVQPTHTGHRQYLLDVIDYLTGAFHPDGRPVYDLDGIALDYIRFVGSSTGNDPMQVTTLLADVRRVIGNLSLHCYLIASRYTFDGGTYNGNFQSYATVIGSLASQYGQHWEQMAQYTDVMMPMAYTADGSIYNTYALHQAYVQQTAAYARTACSRAGFTFRRVCPTLRTYSDTSETTTDQTIDASIRGALLGGGNGYQAFRYGHLVGRPTWWAKLAQYAVPGQNWPHPSYLASAYAVSSSFDPSLSRDADQPAASLQVRFDLDDDGVFDTGWFASGAASYVARYPTLWRTSMQVRDGDGHISTTRRRYTAGPVLSLSPSYFSATFGGSVQIRIDGGPHTAGTTYLVLGTLSGTSPGFQWRPGFPVPINVDWVTTGLAANPNSAILQNGLGVLDGAGRGVATFQLPPGLLAPLAGATVHWSVMAADVFGRAVFTGEADPMLILP